MIDWGRKKIVKIPKR